MAIPMGGEPLLQAALVPAGRSGKGMPGTPAAAMDPEAFALLMQGQVQPVMSPPAMGGGLVLDVPAARTGLEAPALQDQALPWEVLAAAAEEAGQLAALRQSMVLAPFSVPVETAAPAAPHPAPEAGQIVLPLQPLEITAEPEQDADSLPPAPSSAPMDMASAALQVDVPVGSEVRGDAKPPIGTPLPVAAENLPPIAAAQPVATAEPAHQPAATVPPSPVPEPEAAVEAVVKDWPVEARQVVAGDQRVAAVPAPRRPVVEAVAASRAVQSAAQEQPQDRSSLSSLERIFMGLGDETSTPSTEQPGYGALPAPAGSDTSGTLPPRLLSMAAEASLFTPEAAPEPEPAGLTANLAATSTPALQASPVLRTPVQEHVMAQPRLMAEAAPQLVLRVKEATENGVESISVDLRPPELGRVELRLTFREGTVQVVMMAERPETFEALRQERHSLMQQMEQAGLQLGGNGLDLQHGSFAWAEREAQEPERVLSPDAALAEDGAADAAEQPRRVATDSLIDIVA